MEIDLLRRTLWKGQTSAMTKLKTALLAALAAAGIAAAALAAPPATGQAGHGVLAGDSTWIVPPVN